MKPKHFAREARRARHLSARIKVAGRAHCECRVLDISNARREDRRRPRCPGSFRTGLFRRRSKSSLRSGLAARQDDRRQVHLLSGSTRVDQSCAAGAEYIRALPKCLFLTNQPWFALRARPERGTSLKNVTAKSADRCSLRASWRSVVRLPRHIYLRYDVDVCSDLTRGLCIRNSHARRRRRLNRVCSWPLLLTTRDCLRRSLASSVVPHENRCVGIIKIRNKHRHR